MLTQRTMQGLVDAVRVLLVEPYLPPPDTTNFWSQSTIVAALNIGMRRVWQIARNDKGSQWFVRRILSTDPVISIYGSPYNPAAMRCTSGATELIFPPDMGELVMLEPLPLDTTDTSRTADVRFRFESGLNGKTIRELTRNTVGLSEYWGAVVQRPTGPRYVFRAPFQDAEVDVQIEYIMKPDSYALADDFAGAGFDDIMLDAVISYALMECRRIGDNPAKLTEAKDMWNERRGAVIEAVGPLQTVEYETVAGWNPEGV